MNLWKIENPKNEKFCEFFQPDGMQHHATPTPYTTPHTTPHHTTPHHSDMQTIHPSATQLHHFYCTLLGIAVLKRFSVAVAKETPNETTEKEKQAIQSGIRDAVKRWEQAGKHKSPLVRFPILSYSSSSPLSLAPAYLIICPKKIK